MRKLFVLLLLLSSSFAVNYWLFSHGAPGTAEEGNTAIANGTNYFFAGSTSINAGDGLILRVPAAGTPLTWMNSYGTVPNSESFLGGIACLSGAPQTYNFVGQTADCGATSKELMVQLDLATGAFFNWKYCYEQNGFPAVPTYGYDIKDIRPATLNFWGGLITGGWIQPAGNKDALFLHTQPQGSPVNFAITLDRGAADQIFYGVDPETIASQVWPFGYYYAVGSDSSLNSPGGMGAIIEMLNSSNAPPGTWTCGRKISSVAPETEVAYDVAFDSFHGPNGQVVAVGASNAGGVNYKMFVVAIAGACGAQLWSDYITTVDGDAKAYAVTIDPDDHNYLVAGYGTFLGYGKQIFVTKLNAATGAWMWSKHYGSAGVDEYMSTGGGIAISAAPGFIVSGLTANGANDLFAVSANSTGDIPNCGARCVTVGNLTSAGPTSMTDGGFTVTSPTMHIVTPAPVAAAFVDTANQTCPTTPVEICNNLIDDDGDLLIDCADLADCAGGAVCNDNDVCTGGVSTCAAGVCQGGTELCCANLIDDDDGGGTDCGDADCNGAACDDGNPCTGGDVCAALACSGLGKTELCCANGIDDNAVRGIDCADTDCNNQLCNDLAHPEWPIAHCGAPGPCACTKTENPNELTCNDGLDNDCGGGVDCADAVDCNGRSCDIDTCTTGDACAGGLCGKGTETATNACCSNTIDDNSAGGTDCADASCTAPICGGAGVCGDLVCNAGETCTTCPGDCSVCGGAHCGDAACNGAETCASCARDCGVCAGPGGPATGGRVYSAPAFDLLGIAALMALAVLVVVIVMYRRE
jgi:hypothetical protein